MKLSELLLDLQTIPSSSDGDITGLTENSQHVLPGYLFIARPGTKTDGQRYIAEAIERGAVAVVREIPAFVGMTDETVPIFDIKHLSEKIGLLAARFYGYPARQLKMIGITGTNGKTSCAQFTAMALEKIGQPCGVIGTLGNGRIGQLQPTLLTTPDPIILQQTFARLVKQGVRATAMEVSSHALVQHRITGIQFDIGVFTNLTRDHLDYHGTMENYALAKRSLFEHYGVEHAVINAEDGYGNSWLKEFSHLKRYAYSTQPVPRLKEVSYVVATEVAFHSQGFIAQIDSPWGQGELHSPLLGRFNLSNLLAVLTTLGIMGISLRQALSILAQLPGVPGRMQTLGGNANPLIVVDYAHTPDALQKTLEALRHHCSGQLWCVFGCGGDRDRGKRPLMGEVAERYADFTVITDDNPRTENAQTIVEEIFKGLSSSPIKVEHDRQKAIQFAIENAKVGDVVLIAGKGHEMYQQIGLERFPFNDVEIVNTILNAHL